MEDFLMGLEILLFVVGLGLWVIAGFVGAAWLMIKGYTMEMFGCLGVLYGGALILIALFGPIMLVIAWALPSRTDPTQEGGIKKVLRSKPNRKSLPQSNTRSEPPSKPISRSPTRRRPQVSDSRSSRRRSIPPGRSSSKRPKPPKRRS